jgi:PAS domain S-box-containing protein
MNRLFQSLSKTEDGAFIIDEHHRIVFWNQAAERMLGYKAAEVAGLQCFEILGGRDEEGNTLCQRFCRVAIQAERGDSLPNQDVMVTTKTGERRWLNVSTFAYVSNDMAIGQVIVHLFRDVTENMNHQRFFNQVVAASEQLQQSNHSHTIPPSVPLKPQGSELTKREWQVLRLMAQGLATNEMADSMAITQSTVRNHVQNILDKLSVHSRLEAIAYAFQYGLINYN